MQQLKVTMYDGKELIVTPRVDDRLAFETALRRNRGWGKLQDNGLKLVIFMGWHAAKREFAIPLTWDEFSEGEHAALNVESYEPDDAEDAIDDDGEPLEVEGLGEDTPGTPFTI